MFLFYLQLGRSVGKRASKQKCVLVLFTARTQCVGSHKWKWSTRWTDIGTFEEHWRHVTVAFVKEGLESRCGQKIKKSRDSILKFSLSVVKTEHLVTREDRRATDALFSCFSTRDSLRAILTNACDVGSSFMIELSRTSSHLVVTIFVVTCLVFLIPFPSVPSTPSLDTALAAEGE